MQRQARPVKNVRFHSVKICYGKSVRPSVCLSVTLRYCVKMRKRRGMRSSLSGSPVSQVFLTPRMVHGEDPFHIKFECKGVDPCKNSRAVHISPHNSRTVVGLDSDKSSINANRKSKMDVTASHQTRLCVIPTFP